MLRKLRMSSPFAGKSHIYIAHHSAALVFLTPLAAALQITVQDEGEIGETVSVNFMISASDP